MSDIGLGVLHGFDLAVGCCHNDCHSGAKTSSHAVGCRQLEYINHNSITLSSRWMSHSGPRPSSFPFRPVLPGCTPVVGPKRSPLTGVPSPLRGATVRVAAHLPVYTRRARRDIRSSISSGVTLLKGMRRKRFPSGGLGKKPRPSLSFSPAFPAWASRLAMSLPSGSVTPTNVNVSAHYANSWTRSDDSSK